MSEVLLIVHLIRDDQADFLFRNICREKGKVSTYKILKNSNL